MPNLYPEQKKRLFSFLILVVAFTAFATGLNFAAGRNASAGKNAGTLGVSDYKEPSGSAISTLNLRQLNNSSPYAYELIVANDKLDGINANEIIRLNSTDCESLNKSIDLAIVNSTSDEKFTNIEFKTTEKLISQQQITLISPSNQLLLGCIEITD